MLHSRYHLPQSPYLKLYHPLIPFSNIQIHLFLFIYFFVPGLSCGMWDLTEAAGELLAEAHGI